MGQSFEHLLSPFAIGSMQLKNRMVMSPMTTAYCNADQTPSDRLIDYFTERAKGGVGLITMELITVDEKYPYMHRSMTLGGDKYVDHHRRITDAIHQHGCKVQPQISHPGPESASPLFGGPQPVGPSVSVSPVWGWPSRELAIDELAEIAIQYGEAARRAREAGYDGIELHAAHCYNLLGSFISPLRNKRVDEYSAFKRDSRTRFICEVLAEIQARAGADFPITLSISGYERVAGGRSLDDTQKIAPELVAAGVSAFRVSGGVSDSLVTMMVNRSDDGDAVNVSQAQALKQLVDVPVIVVGRIHSAELAEQIIANQQADLIAMARPLLADPYFPQKVQRGLIKQIRPCISCENCIDSMQTEDNLCCAVNPISGRESELLFPVAGKKVLIVGAGAAGMEAARLAAEAGHRVTLLERQQRLGGSLVPASTVHSDNEPFLNWLLAELKRLPVMIKTGVIANAENIIEQRPDVVIIATGAEVNLVGITGEDNPGVITGRWLRQLFAGSLIIGESVLLPVWMQQLINRSAPVLQRWLTPNLLRLATKLWMPVGGKVAIVGNDLAAIELAEFLAKRRRQVGVLSSGDKLIPEVGKKRRHEHMDRLDKLGITVNTALTIAAVDEKSVTIDVSGKVRRLAFDTVIVAGKADPDNSLARSLDNSGITTYSIGDCTGLGLIAKATRSAAEVVSEISQ
jgi:2,4-dienoyl-CoA reductase (NADPH2)